MEQTVCADTTYTPYAEPDDDSWHYDTDTAYGAWSRCTYTDYAVRGSLGCGWRLRAYKETRYRPEECLVGDPILIACTTCEKMERDTVSNISQRLSMLASLIQEMAAHMRVYIEHRERVERKLSSLYAKQADRSKHFCDTLDNICFAASRAKAVLERDEELDE